MKLLQPLWLLLIFPLWVFFLNWKWPLKTLRAIRITLIVFLLLGLCGVALRMPDAQGKVVLVIDRSRSMPPGSDEANRELINLIQANRPNDNELEIVSFGQNPAFETLGAKETFSGFTQEIGPEESDLSGGIERALSLIARNTPGRIMVVSDGIWTGKDPGYAAMKAAAEGISVDFRLLQRTSANDTSVFQITGPESVTPGESFMLNAWIRSPVAQEVRFELSRGKAVLESGSRKVPSGVSRIVFRDRAELPGNLHYYLKIAGQGKDPTPENNIARLIIPCQGPRPILLVSNSAGSGLGKILTAGNLNVLIKKPSECEWSIEALSDLSAVIIENISAEEIGVHAMKSMAAWVRDTGAGLMITGGKKSYGTGGYYKSPLEPVMPISMELRSEHRKLSLGIVVVLDRSGSMSLPASGGKKKMDLANMATVEVLSMLGPMDEFGVIAVDSAPHVISDLGPADGAPSVKGKVLAIESMGGGIFINEALGSAFNMVRKSRSTNRHIILFADAADSEEPGEYKRILEDCAKESITVTAIGLGKPIDLDADLLRDIAKRGNGRIYFTDDAMELPRIFAQDTFVVSKSTFVEGTTGVKSTTALDALLGKSIAMNENVDGYNLCYLRQGAFLCVQTTDEYKAPFVSAWNAGMGRVLCYAGEADGAFTGGIASWKELGSFFTSLARWVAGESSDFAWNSQITQSVINGVCRVEIHLDPERPRDPFKNIPRISTLLSVPGENPQTRNGAFIWTTSDDLSASIPLHGNEVGINVITIDGKSPVSLPPVCLPYSMEHRPADGNEGKDTLEKIAKGSNGKERIDPTTIWKDLPVKARFVDITPFFLLAAILLLLLEVLERRIKIFSKISFPWKRRESPALSPVISGLSIPHPEDASIKPGVGVQVGTTSDLATTDKSNASASVSAAVQPPPKEEVFISALEKARRRAKNRTDKDSE